MKAKQTTLNRLQQAEDLVRLEDEIKAIRQFNEIHQKESHHYYSEVIKKCTTKCDRILEPEAKSNLEEEELGVLKNSFSLVMSKPVPYWGQSAQPGSTNSY